MNGKATVHPASFILHQSRSMKNLTKTALCALYKYTGAMRAQEALTARTGRSCMAVLLFHRVTDATPADGLTVSTHRFRKLCGRLRRGFHVVPLAEIYRVLRSGGVVPHRTLAITFDDCYRDNLHAARVLAEFGLPATFFLPTAFVGTRHVFAWDRTLPPMPNLTWDDVRVMASMGFEIGSHTVTHANLGAVSAEEARHELVASKAVLEDRLGNRVRYLAYPFGGMKNFRPELTALAEEVGYEGCLSGYGGLIYRGNNPRLLPREPVPSFPSDLNLELHLSGCLNWFYAMKRRVRHVPVAETAGSDGELNLQEVGSNSLDSGLV